MSRPQAAPEEEMSDAPKGIAQGYAEAAADVAGPALPQVPVMFTRLSEDGRRAEHKESGYVINRDALSAFVRAVVDERLLAFAEHLKAGGQRLNLAADIRAFLTAPARQDAQVPTHAAAAARVVAAWKAVGKCEDEFGSPSEYCAERYDDLDAAIAILASLTEGST